MKIKNKISKIITSIGTFCAVVSTRAKAYDPAYGIVAPREELAEKSNFLEAFGKIAIIPLVVLIGLGTYFYLAAKKGWQKVLLLMLLIGLGGMLVLVILEGQDYGFFLGGLFQGIMGM